MSTPHLKFAECPTCRIPLSFRYDINQWYCSDCGYTFDEKPLVQERLSEDTFTSGATIETTVQQRVVLPRTRPTYNEFKELKEEVERLKATLASSLPKVVIIEEKSKEQAKKEVEEYFKKHKTTDIEELMLNLRIEVRTLVEIIDELKEEGIIEESEETVDT